MTNDPCNDVLLQFEQERIPGDYREYYAVKRHNLFATIELQPDLWRALMLLDQIVLREIQDMERTTDVRRVFPLVLYMNMHVKMRLALELGCSACLAEAHSLLRDAIESAAHAHRMLSDPELQKIWLSKNDGDHAALEAFNREFWREKEDRLFDGLSALFEAWKRFSEWGSHTNVTSLQSRVVIKKTSADCEFRLNYTGVEPHILVPALLDMLLVFREMERVLFSDYEDRLKLDNVLVGMRNEFERDKEKLRWKVIREFKISRPE
jgi:hypothetical protein